MLGANDLIFASKHSFPIDLKELKILISLFIMKIKSFTLCALRSLLIVLLLNTILPFFSQAQSNNQESNDLSMVEIDSVLSDFIDDFFRLNNELKTAILVDIQYKNDSTKFKEVSTLSNSKKTEEQLWLSKKALLDKKYTLYEASQIKDSLYKNRNEINEKLNMIKDSSPQSLAYADTLRLKREKLNQDIRYYSLIIKSQEIESKKIAEQTKARNDSLARLKDTKANGENKLSKLDIEKSWWAIHDSMAISLAPYLNLNADFSPGICGSGRYCLQLPSFLCGQINCSYESSMPRTSSYYLTLSVDKSSLQGYFILTGTFINKKRYREDKDAFVALVDINEKELTKKVKLFAPLEFRDKAGQETNDYGIKVLGGRDGSLYVVTASINYDNSLGYSNGEKATYRVNKIDNTGNLRFSNDISITSRLHNEVQRAPVLEIFEDKRYTGYERNCNGNGGCNVIVIVKEDYPQLINLTGQDAPETYRHRPDFGIRFIQYDSNGGYVRDPDTYMYDNYQLFISNQSGNFSAGDFNTYGGFSQDQSGNYYLVQNFNGDGFYRMGTPWYKIKELLLNEKKILDQKLKSAKDFFQTADIRKEYQNRMSNIIKSNTISSEIFQTHAINPDFKETFLKSNYLLLKLDENFQVIFCKIYTSDEPRQIKSFLIDNANSKLILTGNRGAGLKTSLNVELDLNGAEISNNGRR